MIKALFCLISGHNYELMSHKSIGPSGIKSYRSETGFFPESMEMQLVGYTKIVQVCKKCGHIKTTISLGE